MKSLLLMRHAKSDRGPQYGADFQRPLNPRGQRDAPTMAAFMASHHLLPQLIISSPALRAKSTAEFLARERTFQGQLRFDQRIYLASPAMLIELIQELPDAIDSVMLVGHNPGMEDLIQLLCGCSVRMPTAAIAHLRLHNDAWTATQANDATLRWLVTPKLLRK